MFWKSHQDEKENNRFGISKCRLEALTRLSWCSSTFDPADTVTDTNLETSEMIYKRDIQSPSYKHQLPQVVLKCPQICHVSNIMNIWQLKGIKIAVIMPYKPPFIIQ